MMMKRRKSLQVIGLAAAGTLAIGYWAKGLDSVRDMMSNSFFKPTEQDLLTSISDTILPMENGYGAVALGVPIYLLKYYEKCIKVEDQNNLKIQLANLDDKANQNYGNDFNECTQEQRETLLMELEQSKDEKEKAFFSEIKGQIIHGFLTTEEVKTQRYNYKLVPHLYTGCIDINAPSIT